MLTFILKKEWYEKIKRGQKTVEYFDEKQNKLVLKDGGKIIAEMY